MALKALYAAPGVQLTNTDYAGGKQSAAINGLPAVGRWTAANNVEFIAGYPQKIAGFSQAIPAGQMLGTPRSMLTWRDTNGTTRLGIGTESRLYAWDGTTLSDITPPVPLKTVAAGTHNGSLNYTSGSTTASIQDYNWNDANALQTGDFVYLACSFATVNLYGWYPVSSVLHSGSNNYITYNVTLPAAPTATGSVYQQFALGYPRSAITSFTTVSGSNVVTVNSSQTIGASAVAFANFYGPYVEISQAQTVNGVTIAAGTYLVTWNTSTSYKITGSGNATASGTVTPATVSYQMFSPSMDQAAYGTTQPVSYASYMVTGSGTNFSNTAYVTFPSVSGMAFGTGAFTIECWVYLNSLNVEQTIIDGNPNASSNTAWRVFFDSSNNICIKCSNGTLSDPAGISTGGWHHIAITRNAGQILTIYVDGNFITNTFDSNNYGFSQGTIGNDVGLTTPLKGMISNLRINTTNLYTGNFTPPTTALTAIAGTKLLACQSATLIDNSGGNVTLTAHGTASAQAATGNPSYLAVSSPPSSYPVQNFPLGWSLASYGGYLLASPHGGTVYAYDPTISGANANRVEGAPQNCTAMFVTPERMVVCLGAQNTPQPGGLIASTLGFTTTPPCWTPQATGTIAFAGSPLTLAWSDQSDFSQWYPTQTNTASNRNLVGYGGYLVGGIAVRDGYSLVLTNRACFAMSYTGNTLIYDTPLIADNAGLVSCNAICSIGGQAFWLADKEIWMWSGSVQAMPTDDVRDWFFANLNTVYQNKCSFGVNRKKKQIRLFFPSGTATENSNFLIYQLDSQVWSTGSIGRAAWEDARLFTTPVSVDSSGTVYFEESGTDANGAALPASITYASMDLASGDYNIDFFGFIPDFERQSGAVTLTLNTKNYPQNPFTTYGPYTITPWDTTPQIDLRADGRQVGFTLSSNTVGGDFRLGLPRVEIQPSGARG